MGNFKPRDVGVVLRDKTKNVLDLKTHYETYTAPNGQQKIMVTNEDAILAAMYHEEYALVQNIVTSRSVWLNGDIKPSVRHSTLLRFESKGLIEQTSKAIPNVYWGLTRTGMRHCERLFGSRKAKPVVTPEKPQTETPPVVHINTLPPGPTPEPKPHEDKLKVDDQETFMNRLLDGTVVFTVTTKNPLAIAKLKFVLGLQTSSPPIAPVPVTALDSTTVYPRPSSTEGKSTRGVVRTAKVKGYHTCFYCKKQFPYFKETKGEPFRYCCKEKGCLYPYQRDLQTRKALRAEGADISNL